MLELLYNKAVDDDLDMVYCGIYRNTDTEQSIFDFPLLDDKIEMIKQITIWGNFTPSLCNKLIRYKVYEKTVFPTANYGEDRQVIIQAIYYASRIDYTQATLYHYYINNDSLSNNDSKILQRYNDEYEIALWTIKFLKNNYSACFDTFEPELSVYMNSLKLHFVQEKPLRDRYKLQELYTNSNKQIFDTAWKESFFNKVLLFLAVNHFPVIAYFFVDTLNFAKKILRMIYRILIPASIRSFIWKKRNKEEDS
jgi:hypothetical protein